MQCTNKNQAEIYRQVHKMHTLLQAQCPGYSHIPGTRSSLQQTLNPGHSQCPRGETKAEQTGVWRPVRHNLHTFLRLRYSQITQRYAVLAGSRPGPAGIMKQLGHRKADRADELHFFFLMHPKKGWGNKSAREITVM